MAFKVADFEETEYRGPLFIQLSKRTNNVWEPGQVFEKHIGIDGAFLNLAKAFWTSLGRKLPSGRILTVKTLKFIPKKVYKKRAPPSFKLNLFIQAKRCEYTSKASSSLQANGITGPHWRFKITPHQQLVLERLKAEIGSRGVVVYAAPAFHTRRRLQSNTILGRMVAHSTFPDVISLKGHSAWNYNKPGAHGVANEDPEKVFGLGLVEKIQLIVGQSGPVYDLEDNFVFLDELQRACAEAANSFFRVNGLTDEMMSYTSVVATLNAVTIDRFSLKDLAAVKYFEVLAFCNAFGLEWKTIG